MSHLKLNFIFWVSLVLVYLSFVGDLSGQITIALESQNDVSKKDYQCFDISLQNKGRAAGLAGYNLRLYYNSGKMMVDESSIDSYVTKGYTPWKVVDHYFDVDASGFGSLPYSHRLGFINIACDLNQPSDAQLLKSRSETKIGKICFDMVPGEEPELKWGSMLATADYATAFVEIALIDANGNPVAADIDDYIVTSPSGIVNSNIKETSFDCSPNPFVKDIRLNLNHQLEEPANIKVKDIFGNTVLDGNIPANETNIQLEAGALPSGAYIIYIYQKTLLIGQMKVVKLSH